MPIIKSVNETDKVEYRTEQDVCSLLCYIFDPKKKQYIANINMLDVNLLYFQKGI